MNVHWTDTAESHLDAIYNCMVDRLTRRSQQIGKFPFSGRRVSEYDIDPIREVIEGSYRIVYYIKPDRIDVLAVLHGAMNVIPTPEQEKK